MSKNCWRDGRQNGAVSMPDGIKCEIEVGNEKVACIVVMRNEWSAFFQYAKSFMSTCIFALIRTKDMVDNTTLGELSI